jgi:hypothetical protein
LISPEGNTQLQLEVSDLALVSKRRSVYILVPRLSLGTRDASSKGELEKGTITPPFKIYALPAPF